MEKAHINALKNKWHLPHLCSILARLYVGYFTWYCRICPNFAQYLAGSWPHHVDFVLSALQGKNLSANSAKTTSSSSDKVSATALMFEAILPLFADVSKVPM